MLTKEQLGERLRETLIRANKSQSALAEAVGSSPAKISNYVRGITFPPIDVLTEMARVLNVSLDYLCELDHPQNTASKSPQSLGDVAQTLFSMRVWDTVSFENVEVTEQQKIDNCGYPETVEEKTTYPALIFKAGELRSFVEDWRKVDSLFREKTFDFIFYNRWVQDRLNSLDSISVETQNLFGLLCTPLEEESTDELPF